MHFNLDFNKKEYSLEELKELYKKGEKERSFAYTSIKRGSADILKNRELACLHVQYCLESGFYDEASVISEQLEHMYPNSELSDIIGYSKKDNYNKKAKDYNNQKRNDTMDDCCCCCDICDICDVCIDFGKFDVGCIDIGDICFCDC